MTAEEKERAWQNAQRYGILSTIFNGFEVIRFLLSFFTGTRPIRTVEEAREAIQDGFEEAVATIAPIAQDTLATWHTQMLQLIRGYLLAQAIAARGRSLLPSELAQVELIIEKQVAFLKVFVIDLIQREITTAYVTNRSVLYGGAGRALSYRIAEEEREDGWVVDFLAVDDGGTCHPCHQADVNSPYPLGLGPMPGEVCLGRGRCRCRRVRRFDRIAWAALQTSGIRAIS